MYVTYVLNTPASIFIPYKIVKGFLEESTIKKINFYNNGNPIKLFTHCHPSQIEQVYHGTAPTLANNFWYSLSLIQNILSYFLGYQELSAISIKPMIGMSLFCRVDKSIIKDILKGS